MPKAGSNLADIYKIKVKMLYVSEWEPKTSLDVSPGTAYASQQDALREQPTDGGKAAERESTRNAMSIAVIGSRTFTDYQTLESVMLDVLKEKGANPREVTIVSGGAKGADSLARDFAQKHGAQCMEFLPDWEKHGKSAGVLRNADIVKNSDFVLAFWDGQSRGTRHSLEFARKNGIPYYAYNFVTQKEALLEVQGNQPQDTAPATGDSGQDTARTVAEALKNEAGQRFGSEALNHVVFASVPSSNIDQTHRADIKFTEAGFFAHYAGDGSLRCYRKSPQKTGDGGAIIIRIEPMAGGAFSVLSEYEKNYILDGRRKHAATASSADEALAIAANFEKYLLPEKVLPAPQVTPMPNLRMR
jgi:hypothetical protein